MVGPRGAVRAGRQAAAAGNRPDRRGRMRGARADRRLRQGPAGAAGRARVPDRRGGPRLRRKPALPADAGVLRPGRRRALREVHGGTGGADRGPLRRLAQVRARHGPQHGALGRARVGSQGHGDDVARKGTGRPRRDPQPGLGAQPRRRRSPEQPQDPAADRGRDHRLRGVRVLRAGLPQPQHHDHAAAANRSAPRARAAAAGLAGVPGAACRLRARRDRDLCGRRNVRGGMPAGHRHRQGDQGVSQRRAQRSRGAGSPVRRAALRGSRTGGARRPASGRGPGVRARHPCSRAGDRRPARPGRRRARSVVAGRLGARRPRVSPGHRARRAPRPCTCPPA